MIMGGAWAGTPAPASDAVIAALVKNDAASLPNKASLVVAVCRNSTTK
jgi:hypothetical protein